MCRRHELPHGFRLPAAPTGHLKLRYKFHKVCKIFGIHEDTLRSWMRDGVPLPDGTRVKIHFVHLGPRRKEFEVDEIERVYQALRDSSDGTDADVLPFRDGSESDVRNARRRAA